MTLLVANKPLAVESDDLTANIADMHAGPHALTFSDYKQVLYIRNGEAVPITATLLGDGVTTFTCPTYGAIDVSGGKVITIAAGKTITVYTSKIGAYMGAAGTNVVITIASTTASDLATCWLVEH